MFRRALLVVSAGCLLAFQLPAGAGGGSRTPVNYAYLIQQVAAGDHYRIECSFPEGFPKQHALMESFTAFDGTVSNAGWFAIENDGDLYASVRLDELQLSANPLPSEEIGTFTFSQDEDLVAPAAGFVRAAWAGWGEPYSCGLTVNGAPRPSVGADPTRAFYASATDFSRGVGADTTYLGAGVNGSLTHTAHGYLFAGMASSPAGLLAADGPSGEHFEGSGFFVAQETSGVWEYRIDLAVTNQGSGPLLVVMELEE